MVYKRILALSALAALTACTAAVPTDDTGTSVSSAAVNPAADDSDSMVDVDEPMAGARVIDVQITDWSFTPATITAKQGEVAQLRLKGDKGIHSLLVADLGLNVRVEAGQETIVPLPTDTAGTFAGRCGVPCGPGHRDMKFTIVVE